MKKIMAVFGTRPEAIKMCPLILELKKHKNVETIVCLTGQHKEMLQQVMDAFDIKEDYNLNIMRECQTLTTITSDVLIKIEEKLIQEKPDIVLVHGDTTTSFVAGLAAFYQQIPVGHVEAGLRTGNKYSPFPEEMNRLLTARLATYHFAPTERNKHNLEVEGIKENIYVTGNTVIDAFQTTVKEGYDFKDKVLSQINYEVEKVILVTAHRRENLGQPLINICNALKEIAEKYDNIKIIYPVHMNPAVRRTVYNILQGIENIILTEPLDVLDMHNVMARSFFVMTDSGGIQEEAPACGKPVLVLRTETERPEAVDAGTVQVVGIEQNDIFKEACNLIENKELYERMARAVNPYGDGHASERIVKLLLAE